MEGCLDGALAVHDDRVELTLPHCIPVGRRDEVGRVLYVKSVSFCSTQNNLQCMCIVEFLLDVTFQIRVLAAE